ncbi:MAG: tRNA uridine-5-carboxymethylaminomethyl(34) synthesis GTPase MnmE [Hymenobacteraceae bacterium]|nr:tRNA uridine-5-carboxymethylaminomethyl(34) synthesis GTPase MnmE [Hymenobacteraceae bacterium]MDX5510726.1 tRNA uridine-5-carboxymethylaminomethyl(34) synthesis GTPase MnmE [Hymenobacteraceae bacterium]
MSVHTPKITDTIVALATAQGPGAIAVIRLSGNEAIRIVNEVFFGKNLEKQPSHTAHFGTIRDGETIIDEVLVTLFVAPRSYTKEHVVAVSCHGSEYIVQQLIRLFLKHGARRAVPGEFTKRAFRHGQMDLAQAEAVADLISSNSAMQHQVALRQMRGGFSNELKDLRAQLVHFASMIELELDFGEEDVEFADRDQLRNLIFNIQKLLRHLMQSFEMGNVIKEGVPTVIAGKPNAGKSTLLNVLLNEEKAIVSEIAGTTRDFIEDEISIEGIRFRFIDTAGLRDTTDVVEAMGVERTRQKIQQAALVVYLFDINTTTPEELQAELEALQVLDKPLLPVANKTDKTDTATMAAFEHIPGIVYISAAEKEGIEELRQALLQQAKVSNAEPQQGTILTNLRHLHHLENTYSALDDTLNGLALGLSGDLVAADIRRALRELGAITGEISTDDLLDNIFTKFCIGK